jgi:hypothetical protein
MFPRSLSFLRIALACTALATAAATWAATSTQGAPPVSAATREAPADLWLGKLNVRHKMLFDSPEPNGGVGLAHLHNFYETYNRSYGVPDSEIRGVFTFYGATTLYGLNDAMWTRYRLGELLSAEDPSTGRPSLVNPWRETLRYRGQLLPGAGVEALQQRGAIFLVCDFALGVFAARLAQANGLEAEAVLAELRANVLPGVEIVPSVVVSIEQAHRAGLAYQRK